MRRDKYNRLLRSIGAMILQSDMTDKELKELLNMLENGRIGRDIEFLLRDFLWNISSTNKNTSFSDDHDLFDVVMDSEISKASLINIIASMTNERMPSKVRSIEQIISFFEKNSNISQREKLIDMLKSDIKDDEYLKGISERNQK